MVSFLIEGPRLENHDLGQSRGGSSDEMSVPDRGILGIMGCNRGDAGQMQCAALTAALRAILGVGLLMRT